MADAYKENQFTAEDYIDFIQSIKEFGGVSSDNECESTLTWHATSMSPHARSPNAPRGSRRS